MKSTSLYSRALQFAVAGYSVIPVGKDKKPLLNSWKKYQTTPATEEEIEKWWEMWPDANIGIVTGKVSGISVIDLDTQGKKETATSITLFPATFTVRTGNGGYHLYYQYQKGLTVSANAYPQYPGLDIRSDGGFVVAPYSTTDYLKDGKRVGGEYSIIENMEPVPFPIKMFASGKGKRTLSSKIGVGKGGRNDSITSFIGQLLHSAPETEWESEVWPAVERANRTYSPPLPPTELRTSFESIVKKEQARRQSLILSPIQMEDGEDLIIRLEKNSNGVPYKDMANVLNVLSQHPYYKDAIRYNEFRQEIEYNNKPLEDGDLVKIQFFMQKTVGLRNISKEAVHAAVTHYANQNSYDEAKDWLVSLEWDGTPRLANWLTQATGVEDDDYHAGIGAQWFMGMVRRIMEPGSTFDYVLLLIGGQGIGKTSFFRILGGPWYKSYTGQMDNKDFYLALRGAMIVDLDEGAALYRSEAIKIKSIITETHDEYRAPYDRVMKKYPRRFVFSMSTNDTQPFRDMTGNRRYWVVELNERVNFEWLTENRAQLFAEGFHNWKHKIPVPEVPLEKAVERQADRLPEDAWEDLVMNTLCKRLDYIKGDPDFAITIQEIFTEMFPEESMARFTQNHAMRIAAILKSKAGMDKRRSMVEGERKNRWMLTEKRINELQANLKDTRDEFDKYGEEDDDPLNKA